MKRITLTNKSTLIGLLGGGVILALTAVLSRDSLPGLLNLPGLLMVLGGTITATLVSRPVHDVSRALGSLRSLIHEEETGTDEEIIHLSEIAYWYRAGNIKAAEQTVAQVGNPLLRSGAQLVIDREPIDDIIKIMRWRITGVHAMARADAQVLRTMATFAPVFGMLGTLFGLIQMLGHLGHAAMSEIGANMSFALTTTLYGLVLANMILKPLAMKMERRIHHQMVCMGMILEGVVLLHDRRHPTLIKEALTTYLFQQQGGPRLQPQLAKAA